ncbi:MAG TPA: DUF4232 domain-containing protein [Chloroflexota bacterium]
MKIATAVRMAAVAAALAGGIGIGAGRWTGGAAFAASPTCANYQLLVTPIADNGAAGHMSEMFRIHNLLPGSCTLFGYPGGLLLDTNFYSLPTHVMRAPFPEGGPGPALVTLNRSHDAYFVLRWSHLPTPGQKCPTAKYVMITAPNDRLPVVTFAGSGGGDGGIMACGGNLTVSPVSGKRFWA